ncbi:hypothetical protein TTHERM_00144950 (macronuclear) [Tetrahymena thermophila SB210]|uniref:Uncharacterized protein n=1 Tax=Tetrahymena thermophila (strain SB210) TaxID=312017 RepID=I7MI52_TETTS|nr:hypothetical protein TTHERM_00144950 [Tetrahymena thermophila SB210]EAR90890.2 hypothetical protein TTHERM_00144950 [Tetrahymena thermophila SB210]|eukprot:XP_001011135.2 hypothetical protein TTHERM_00144950 [Tetrahymena thermophila SB210]
MIQIDMQRECETRYYSAQKQTNYSDYEDEQCNNQTGSCACTYQTDLELNGMSPTSPVTHSQSSPCFNNKFSSSLSKEQFSEDIQTKNIENQLKSFQIGQSFLNNNRLYSKSHQILSPTPLKAINLTQTFLSISTSNTLSCLQSSAISSKSSSSSCISCSCQKSDNYRSQGQFYQNNTTHSLNQQNTAENNLNHSQDEQYFSVESDYQIKNKTQKDFPDCLKMMNQTSSQLEQNIQNKLSTREVDNQDLHQSINTTSQTQDYQENYDSILFENHRGQKIKSRLFTQSQITQFTLEESNSMNNQNKERKLNYNTNIFSQSDSNIFQQKDTQSLPKNSILHSSSSAPQPTIFNHELFQDDILSIVQLIERESAQNPQSKDEEFLNLNTSYYTEETFEQFKESILSDLLDKSF